MWQGIASVLLFLCLWQVGSGWAESRLFPGPLTVFRSLMREALHGPLIDHLSITLARVSISFIIAMAIGTVLGVALGRLPWLDRWINPWLVILLNVPALVVIILTYVWLGLVETALLVAVAVNKVPNVAVTLREGARALERDYAEVAQIYRFGPWRTLREVIIPQLAPYLLAAARNGLALIWKIVLVVELLGRSNGVGFQLQSYFQLFDVPRVMAYAAAFVLCVLIIEVVLFAPLERRAGRWRR
ncbi:ABC transporter permease [Microvirga makkahensis]|uniref:ABC transporter permease subunit n=1 Tax=Microvirga makkahensis TaxID=1128670 RepID=A0A7X3MSU9_9HYPH|nr:ABC transporter permease [Microvirga makkahensis]MXQ12370.1 ABC transporter permease subunit [Microvirga makkahensis]